MFTFQCTLLSSPEDICYYTTLFFVCQAFFKTFFILFFCLFFFTLDIKKLVILALFYWLDFLSITNFVFLYFNFLCPLAWYVLILPSSSTFVNTFLQFFLYFFDGIFFQLRKYLYFN